MQKKNTSNARNRHNRGVALVTALLLLSLFTVMTLSMVIATTSDTLIDGYYRNARGSFYASDSGINSARQYLINQFQAAVPTSYTPLSGVVPILPGTETTTVRALETAFGSYNSMLGTQTASWPGNFAVTYDTSCDTTGGNTSGGSPCPTYILTPTCTAHYKLSTTHATPPSNNVPTCTSLGSSDYQMDYYYYSYPYKLSVTGQSRSGEKNTIEEQGAILATVQVSTSANQAFAAWGMFIDQYSPCSSALVPGTISGPVFTNGTWNFGTGGSYIFTDPVGSVGSNFGYEFGSCIQSPASSYTSGGQIINPTFRGGFNLGQQAVTLPTDSFNQKEAVVDGVGTSCAGSTGCPSTTTLNAGLRDINGTAFPTSGASGVFLGYSQTTTGGVTTNTMTGGGILVEGNAGVTMTASTAGSDNVQVYTITQSSTTTTVTIDLTANTTKVVSGAKTTVIQGVPDNRSNATSPSPSTMLYVDGTISSLTGPSSGAAIQDGYGTTVAASGDINITGNILYKTEPVTLTQNQIPNTPADTLIPGNSNGQVLGIFTANGNVNLNLSSSGQNLEIDASIATISQGGSGGIVNTGQAINTLTIVGGRIQNTIQNINASTRNVWFDRRFAQGGFAPPFFPSTNVITTVNSTDPTVTASRVTWVNTSAQ